VAIVKHLGARSKGIFKYKAVHSVIFRLAQYRTRQVFDETFSIMVSHRSSIAINAGCRCRASQRTQTHCSVAGLMIVCGCVKKRVKAKNNHWLAGYFTVFT
jgi:hypothetical protein